MNPRNPSRIEPLHMATDTNCRFVYGCSPSTSYVGHQPLGPVPFPATPRDGQWLEIISIVLAAIASAARSTPGPETS